MTPASDAAKEIIFEYRNWRGDVSIRRVLPQRIWFGATEWHPGAQWLLEAFDLEKNEVRDFALCDITFVRPR